MTYSRDRGVIDPECRWARASRAHRCTRNTGEPLRPGESCFIEANSQLEERDRLYEAKERVAEKQAGPEYRYIDLREGQG